MESPAVPARLIGAIFVERGLVTQEALDEALAEQARTGQLLGEILVARFGVSRLELASAIAEQWAELERGGEADPGSRDDERAVLEIGDDAVPIRVFEVGERRPLGEIFVEQGMITEDELAAALRRQSETGERLGEILVAQGAISRLELASALADQWANLQKLRPPEPSWTNGEGADPAEDSVAVSAEIESVRQALAEAEARLQGAVDEIEAARAEGARRLAELAGEMPPLAAEVEALRNRADRLESTGQEAMAGALEDVRARSDQLHARLEEVAARPVADPDTVAFLRAQLDEVGEVVQQVTARPTVDPEQIEALAGRLSAVEGRTDADVRELVQVLSARLDELASRPHVDASAVDSMGEQLRALAELVREAVERPGVDPDFADEVHGRLAQVEGRDDSELRDLLAALSDRLDKIAGRPVVELSILDELQARLNELEARDDSDVRGSVDELVRRIDEIGSRPQLDTAAIDSLRGELWALDERVREGAGRPEADAALVEEVRSRLEALERRDDAELRDRAEELARRLDEVAERSAPHASALEGLHARLDELERRDDAELRGRVEELSQRLEHLTGRPDLDLSALDGLSGRVEELARGLEALAARPDADLSLLEALRSRVEQLEGRDDTALRGRVEELARGLEALAQRPDSDLSPLEALRAQVEQLAARPSVDVAWLDELASRLSAVENRHDDELRSRIEELGRYVGEVTDRLLEVERREDGGLEPRIDALAGQVDELFGRRDEDLLAWVETVQRRVASLEERPMPDGGLGERLDELARLQSAGLEALAERVADAVGAVTARADGLQAADAETRGTLEEAARRVAELEILVLQRVDDVERHVAHLRERVDDDEASAALWRAVDGLQGRAGQALSLLGQLGAQLQELESRIHATTKDDVEVPASASQLSDPIPTPEPDPALGHVLFVHAAEGYGIVPCNGPVPAAGSRVELEAGEDAVVLRVGRSPLPGDERPCAFVERAVAT